MSCAEKKVYEMCKLFFFVFILYLMIIWKKRDNFLKLKKKKNDLPSLLSLKKKGRIWKIKNNCRFNRNYNWNINYCARDPLLAMLRAVL